MSSSQKTTYENSVLIEYLIGTLPESEVERMDELSVSDGEFASRLEAIENDLVDSWARGELSSETLAQFNRRYLSSPEGLNKLRFAQALLAHQNRTEAKNRSFASSAASTSSFHPKHPSSAGIQKFPFLGSLPKWAPAAITLLALVGSAYLATINVRLRRELAHEAAQRQTMEGKQQEILEKLAAHNVENEQVQQITAAQQPSTHPSDLISVLLLPATRGINGIATVDIPRHAEQVRIRLQLEADDFPAYRTALRNSSMSQIVWHKEHLRARVEEGKHIISLTVPAGLLKQQNYVFEVTGVRAGGEEILATYPFRVALR